MKKIIVVIITVGIMMSLTPSSYASDWDKAGKALAIIEGARILTGGNIDLIGNITGVGNNSWFSQPSNRQQATYARAPRRRSSRRTWVPRYTWKKAYIPEHEEYDDEYGRIIVEGHYIKYRIEDGGHWK